MRTIGLRPGDAVLLLERRGPRELVHNALVVRISMEERLAGMMGEHAIEVAFLTAVGTVTTRADVVHLSHQDWQEYRAGLAYEELPYPQPGVCRYCRCTERRPCVVQALDSSCLGGCGWLDMNGTVCDAPACAVQWLREMADEKAMGVNRG